MPLLWAADVVFRVRGYAKYIIECRHHGPVQHSFDSGQVRFVYGKKPFRFPNKLTCGKKG